MGSSPYCAKEGIDIDPRVEDTEYGRFGWITDPEGNRIELWQPPKVHRAAETAGRWSSRDLTPSA
jgi:hypothetical protein